jgi:hypothetical protein
MVLGLSGVVSIVSGLATGKSMETLELTEFPNMPFLYWLAVAGAVVKPKWTDDKKWPALKVLTGLMELMCCSYVCVGDASRMSWVHPADVLPAAPTATDWTGLCTQL